MRHTFQISEWVTEKPNWNERAEGERPFPKPPSACSLQFGSFNFTQLLGYLQETATSLGITNHNKISGQTIHFGEDYKYAPL